MTLRKKAIIYTVHIFVILIICIFVILQITVISRFKQYEREEMAREVNRGVNVLNSDLGSLDTTLKDWSRWDDSYAFLEDGNEEYISSNLAYESLKNIGINVILYVRPSGELQYGAAYDFASGEEVPLPDTLLRHLASSDRLMSFSAGEDGTMGILMVDQLPLLVVARPVLTSNGEGPSRGTMIMGSYLDDKRVERLGRMVALDLSILPVNNPGVPPQALIASDGSPGAEPVFTQPLSSSRIAGYALLNDLYGDSALVMRVEAERDLYHHGQVFLRYLIFILFIVASIFAGAVLFMLEKMVLKPLARFSDRVSEIDTERDLSQRLGAEGKDELSSLAGVIDVMLDNLEHTWQEWQSSEQALRESGEKYRKLMESAGDAIFVVDADSGLILEVNQRAEKLMGRSALELEGMHQALLHPPEEEELYREVYAAHVREGRGFFAEAVVVNKEGVRVPVEINAQAMEVGGRKVVQGIFRDITERKRAEETLHARLEIEKLVSSISGSFIRTRPAGAHGAINDALRTIGTFVGVDRSYIFRFSDDGVTMDNTHEWCAEGIEPQISNLKGLPVKMFPWWMEKLNRLEIIHIKRVTDLPPEARAEREILKAQKTQSLVVVPLVYGDCLIGFLGFDSMRVEKMWAEEDIALLKTMGEIMVNALERKRAEEALQYEREQLLSIFGSLDEIIYISDPFTHEILYANEALRRALGKNPIGGVCYRELQGFDQPCEFCTNEIILENKGEAHEWEYHNPILGRDFAIVDRIIKWPDGRDVRFEFAMDITKRKQAEEELERINHLFLNLGPDLMENIVRVVGAAKEILGVPLAAYARLKAGKLTTLSTAPGEEGLSITEGFEGNISYELISRDAKEPMVMENLEETDYRHTDPIMKEHGFGSFLGYPVELGIRTMGCLCLFDETGRHFSDQEQATVGTLARALSIEEERLAREENLKDFIDVASHELRHPITILKGYSALLRGQRDKIDVATQDVLLEIIDHGSDRLNTLVDGLLAISGIERGRFEVRREARSLVPLIERSIDEMGARGFNNDFSSRISGDLEEWSVDGEKFVQLMVILMENAVKYSPSGSPIEVEAGATEGDVLVSVLDRGMGISEEYRERVFDRFFQEEEVAHHSKPGMGMGLYIARNIVEAHGGRIWCEAREGGGSIFHFTLPPPGKD